MAIPQLTEEQIRGWSREQKDRWWLEHVYRGDMPQLTLRSAATGFLLGGVLAATALYIAGKTGITIGVGLTSVILAFAIYRGFNKLGLAQDFTILENNCTQSIATAAGYMVSPLISALAAYMLVTNQIVPAWHMIAWMIVVAVIGVLLAFPLKRRFINDEQMPFPEGRAAGVVLDALYTGAAGTGMFKARLLGITAAIAAAWQFLVSDGWMKLAQFTLLRMHQWAGMKEPWVIHERLDTYYYAAASYVPRILGTDVRQLGLRLTLDAAMLGVGGLDTAEAAQRVHGAAAHAPHHQRCEPQHVGGLGPPVARRIPKGGSRRAVDGVHLVVAKVTSPFGPEERAGVAHGPRRLGAEQPPHHRVVVERQREGLGHSVEVVSSRLSHRVAHGQSLSDPVQD